MGDIYRPGKVAKKRNKTDKKEKERKVWYICLTRWSIENDKSKSK